MTRSVHLVAEQGALKGHDFHISIGAKFVNLESDIRKNAIMKRDASKRPSEIALLQARYRVYIEPKSESSEVSLPLLEKRFPLRMLNP